MEITTQTKRNLLWIGLQTILASVVGTLAVRAVALAVLGIPPEFPPLAGPGPTIFLTVVGVGAGVGVFAEVRRSAAQPIRLFRIIAAGTLLVSFLPDLWMFTESASGAFPGATVLAVGTLMTQHIVAAAVVVWMLTMRGRGGALYSSDDDEAGCGRALLALRGRQSTRSYFAGSRAEAHGGDGAAERETGRLVQHRSRVGVDREPRTAMAGWHDNAPHPR